MITRKVVEGRSAPTEIMKFLMERLSPVAALDERVLVVIEACLIVADPDQKRRQVTVEELRATADNDGLDNTTRSGARELNRMIDAFAGSMRMGRRMATVAAKIDLAAMVRD